MNARINLLNAFALAGASVLSPRLAAQERVSLSADRVAIYNIAGEVRVERGAGPNVIVEVTRHGRDSGKLELARREQDGWQVLALRSPDRNLVYSRLGRFSHSDLAVAADGTFGLGNLEPELGPDRVTARIMAGVRGHRVRISGRGRGVEAHADLRILVPPSKVVAVHVGVGRVSIDGAAADLQVDARSGSVSVTSSRGFLRVDTGSGSISVNEANGDVGLNTGSGEVKALSIGKGLLKVQTGSGSVDLSAIDATGMSVVTGSGSVTALNIAAPLLKLSTGSGSIRARSVKAEKFDLHTGSGSITLDLRSDVDLGRIQTGSGGVSITTTRAFGAEVTLDTGSGGINVDLPIDLIERKRTFLRARIGDGRGTLQVGTGSGSIAIR